MPDYSIRPLTGADRPWVARFLIDHWGATQVISRAKIHEADCLPGYLALAGAGVDNYTPGERIGLVTFCIQEQNCEIVSINSLVEGIGIGTQLVHQVELTARAAGCKRLWLITSNDNTTVFRFYQKRGLRLVAVHLGALDQARHLKPEIPWVGLDGIPIHDEIEFEKLLD